VTGPFARITGLTDAVVYRFTVVAANAKRPAGLGPVGRVIPFERRCAR